MSPTPASTPPLATFLAELISEAVADGAAVLLSSHEPELAVPLSDRVVVMSGGRDHVDRRRRAAVPS